jgi:hypothetical protein
MKARVTIDKPVLIDRWWKNRAGEAITITIAPYEGLALVHIRNYFTAPDGTLAPGKGFAARVKHLPRLVEALVKAEQKAVELGLLTIGEASDG